MNTTEETRLSRLYAKSAMQNIIYLNAIRNISGIISVDEPMDQKELTFHINTVLDSLNDHLKTLEKIDKKD